MNDEQKRANPLFSEAHSSRATGDLVKMSKSSGNALERQRIAFELACRRVARRSVKIG
jgi:hypothetical protein